MSDLTENLNLVTEDVISEAAAIADAPKPKKKKAQWCIYLGPTISGVIQYGAIYSAAKSAALKMPPLKTAVRKYPGIADLVFDKADFVYAKAQLRDTKSELYKKYKKVKVKK